MNTASFDEKEVEALRRAFEFWLDHWDWECPTLFGIDRDELSVVLEGWPNPRTNDETIALAALGALRELLDGASAIPGSEVERLLGLSLSEAERLSKKTLMLASQVLPD
jgi:hypothetical protein